MLRLLVLTTFPRCIKARIDSLESLEFTYPALLA
jgi:hypothetical protein